MAETSIRMSYCAWACESVPSAYWAGMPEARHQRDAQAGDVERIAGVRPERSRAPRTEPRYEL